jgi:hypothetical protein
VRVFDHCAALPISHFTFPAWVGGMHAISIVDLVPYFPFPLSLPPIPPLPLPHLSLFSPSFSMLSCSMHSPRYREEQHLIRESGVLELELPVREDFSFEPVTIQFELLFQKPAKASTLMASSSSGYIPPLLSVHKSVDAFSSLHGWVHARDTPLSLGENFVPGYRGEVALA